MWVASFGFFMLINCPFRNVISCAIMLPAFVYLFRGKIVYYYLFTVLALSFHFSAVLMLFLPLVKLEKVSSKCLVLIYMSLFILLSIGGSSLLLNILAKISPSILYDRITFYEMIISSAIECGQYEKAIEYAEKAFAINPENANYYIWYFNSKLKKKEFQTYEDLLKLKEDSPIIKQLSEILDKEIKPKIKKSKLLIRLELALNTGDTFKALFNKYFLTNIKTNIPSLFTNVKFIYKFQQYKLPIISEIVTKHLESIKKDKCLSVEFTKEEKIDLIPQIIWVYYYAAQHADYLGDLESALKYINCAIDNNPTVVEFYMMKSKILKHGLYYEESGR